MSDYKKLLETARDRLNDMLRGDDGQAWKEAQRFVDGLDAATGECDKQAEPAKMKYYDENGKDKLANLCKQAEPVAFTNSYQLAYLKDPRYATTPMAMWATRFDETAIPLYIHPAPAVVQEPVHFRAVLCGEQQDQALGVVSKVVGFVDKKAAEQFILEKRDFQGWRYNLEPLYREAPAVAHPPADVVRELMEALEAFTTAWGDCLGFPQTDSERFQLSEARDKAESAIKSAKEHGL